MGRVGHLLKLSACILIFLILENFCVTCNADDWCYDKPECEPGKWLHLGSCNGMRQSPININSETVIAKSNLGPINFTGYGDPTIVTYATNSGYQLRIDLNPKAKISSDSLTAEYYLHQAHLHWGTENTNGAEHTIDGQRYTMELHLVHTKNNMNIEEASKQSNGLVVVSVLIKKIKRNNQVTAWDILAKLAKKVPEKGDSYKLNGEFSIGALLSRADESQYYYYRGSLTTPPCAEAVIWIILANPIEISERVVSQLTTTLYFTTSPEDRKMQNNFRPVQNLNGRKVYYYTEY